MSEVTEFPAFPGLKVAGFLNDLSSLPMEGVLYENWLFYANARVLKAANERYSGRLTHFRFLPDPETGEIIVVEGKPKQYGACKIEYTGSENGATVNLRLALKALEFNPQKGRNYVFPVGTRKGTDGKEYLVIKTKGAQTRPARNRSEETAVAEQDDA